jgi:hypothetical protein
VELGPFTITKVNDRTGRVAQVTECLLNKCEAVTTKEWGLFNNTPTPGMESHYMAQAGAQVILSFQSVFSPSRRDYRHMPLYLALAIYLVIQWVQSHLE